MKPTFGWGVAITIIGSVAAILALPWLVPIAIYRPVRLDRVDPAAWGVRESAFVRFVARDGAPLTGWWHAPADEAAPVVLIAHGRSGNVSTRAQALGALARAGFGVLLFDYRKYGASAGRPSEAALTADTEGALLWIRAWGVENRRVIVLGQSLGDAPAAAVATRHRLGGLVLVSPFASLPDAVAARIPPLGWLYWPVNRFDVARSLAKVDAPVAFVASARNGLVPWDSAIRAAQGAKRPVWWVRDDGLRHDGMLTAVSRDGRLVAIILAMRDVGDARRSHATGGMIGVSADIDRSEPK